jgi:hypothetical protein
MNDESGCRLGDLLPKRIDAMSDTLREELNQDVMHGEGNLIFEFLGSQAVATIDKALDFDVFEALANGWSVVRELAEYSDEKIHPPNETGAVKLGKHSFTTSLHPVLEYRFANLRPPPLKFTLDLTAEIIAVKLEVRERHLIAVGMGEGRVVAQLKYKTIPLHSKLESRAVRLAGRYPLKKPIRIASPPS